MRLKSFAIPLAVGLLTASLVSLSPALARAPGLPKACTAANTVELDGKRLVGDGRADDTAALQAAADRAAGGCLVFIGAGRHRVTGLVVRPGTKLFGKPVLVYDASVPGPRPSIILGKRSSVAALRLEIPAGTEVDRLLGIEAGVSIASLSVHADVQQANRLRPTDGMIRIQGGGVKIDALDVTNVDAPVVIYPGADPTVDGVTLRNVRIRSYQRGIYIRNARNVVIEDADIAGASPNGRRAPGQNAILASSVTGLRVTRVKIADSPEHGIRVGGAYQKEAVSSKLRFQDVTVDRPGACGLKINPAHGQIARDIVIHRLRVTDAGFGSRLGENEDGLRIERADGVEVRDLVVDRVERPFSAHDGIFIRRASNVSVQGVRIVAPKRSVVHVSGKPWQGDDGSVVGVDIRGLETDAPEELRLLIDPPNALNARIRVEPGQGAPDRRPSGVEPPAGRPADAWVPIHRPGPPSH